MKLSISRVLETSKYLSTEAGKQLQEFITFVADLSENVLRSLRNGLTFRDNFDCQIVEATLLHNTEQTLSTTKTPIGIVPLRTQSSDTSNAGLTGFQWWFNTAGEVVVKAQVSGTPAAPTTVKVSLLAVFG